MTGADGENTITTHRKARARPPIQIRETDAERIGNLAIEAEVQILLGHSKIENTVRYLGVDVEDALVLAERIEI